MKIYFFDENYNKWIIVRKELLVLKYIYNFLNCVKNKDNIK